MYFYFYVVGKENKCEPLRDLIRKIVPSRPPCPKIFIFAVLRGEMKGKIILSRVVVVYWGEFLYFSEQTI